MGWVILNRQALAIALTLALVLLAPAGMLVNMSIAKADTAQYMVLASFDFLSADEIKNFQNITLAAQPWNTTLTSYQVLDGD